MSARHPSTVQEDTTVRTPKTTTTPTTSTPTTSAVTDVQAQMGRVDTKAAMLLAGALTALAGGIAVLAKTTMPAAATACGVITVVLIGTAVMLLITAVRPALGGNHGFMHWAAATSPQALATHLAHTDPVTHDAVALWNLSRSARRKYQYIRAAVDLIRLALITAALTGLLGAAL